MATCDLDTLKAEACANDFFCLDKNIQRAVFLQLLCNLNAAIAAISGGSAGSQGSGPPSTAPSDTTATAFYVDTDTGTIYYWNTANQAWQ